MPVHIYSRRLVGPQALTNGPTTIVGTVPTGEVWLIRWLSALNNSSTISSTVRVGLGAANVGANRFFRKTLAPEETFYADLRLPLNAGETIGAYADNLGVCVLTLTGYKFVV